MPVECTTPAPRQSACLRGYVPRATPLLQLLPPTPASPLATVPVPPSPGCHQAGRQAGGAIQPALVSAGSKNPKIALKLAEFQTDSEGKVRRAQEASRSFWNFQKQWG